MRIIQFYPSQESPWTARPTVDVVLVHGLNSLDDSTTDPIKTWTAEDGTVWPRDLLPLYMPEACVLCFQYNGSIKNTTNVAGTKGHAMALLRLLEQHRSDDVSESRPIIFVGHSLGGVIIKQLLILAFERYKPLAKATVGIVFFATPHHLTGLDAGNFLAARILRAVGNHRPKSTLGDVVKGVFQPVAPSHKMIREIHNSAYLTHISDDFLRLLDTHGIRISITNFLEDTVTEGLGGVVVSEADAYLPGSDSHFLPGDHVGICKFGNNPEDKKTFRAVWRALRRLANPASGNTVYDDRTSPNEFQQMFTAQNGGEAVSTSSPLPLASSITPDKHWKPPPTVIVSPSMYPPPDLDQFAAGVPKRRQGNRNGISADDSSGETNPEANERNETRKRDSHPSGATQPYPGGFSDAGRSLAFMDSHTMHGPATDSGYASASLCQKSVANVHDVDMNSSTLVATETCDAGTVYSGEGSIGGDPELDAYQSELVDDLVNKMREFEAEPETLASIFEQLPLRLKCFALRLGQSGSSKAERDVMYFVHKYRRNLSERFKESMLGVAEEDSALHREPDPVDGQVNVDEWLKGVGAPGADEEGPAREPELQPAPLLEDEEIILPDKHGYQQLILESAAYKSLVSSLARESRLTPVGEGCAMEAIRSTILETLPRQRHISRHTASETFTMELHAAWDAVGFLEDQYGSSEKPEALLGRVITLTGSMVDAQALPCSEYLSQTWPMTGPYVLAAVTQAVKTGEQAARILPDRSEFTVYFDHPRRFQMSVRGTADFIAEAGEAVAWLTAALRSSPDEDAIQICTPRVGRAGKHQASGIYYCGIELELKADTESNDSDPSGRCWHAMFRNPVVVAGFPIPRRQRVNTGVEIPLHMAACLTDALRLHDFNGRLCLKGFSAMLAAVEVVGGLVLWHLCYNATGQRVSYLDTDKVACLEGLGVNLLRSSRHVIGWCSDALCMFGDPAANYDMRSSNLPHPGKEFTLEKLSFSVGQIVTGGCQFAIGRKDTPVHITKHSYIAKLRWIEQRYVVMWDEEDKRGWLTKGTGALLHLLRASLGFSAQDKFSSEFLFDPGAFVEATQRFRNDSAIEVLLNTTNRKLRLYALDEESFDETVERPDGRQDVFTKTRRTYTTVEHLVVELFETLEKLIDHEAQGEASAKGVNMKPRVRSHLQGWDFRDVATNRDPLYLRVTTPPSSGRSWIDFAKSTRVVTLFGRGFGELIKPAATPSLGTQLGWQAMPAGQGLLGACMADLRDMIKSEGDRTTHPLTISAGILWHNPSPYNIFVADHSTKPAGWSPVQELLPASPSIRSLLLRFGGSERIDIDCCEHGAVIFGRSKTSKFTWPNVGDPTAVALSEHLDGSPTPTTEAPSDSSADSVEASTGRTVSDNQDTQPTSTTLSRPRSRSGQFLSPPSSNAPLGSCLGSAFQHSSVDSPTGIEAASGSSTMSNERGAATLDGGDELQKEGIIKRLKVVFLTAGCCGLRIAAARTEKQD